MKNYRFSLLMLLAIVGFAGLYVTSCHRDAEQPKEKLLSETPTTERACGTGCILYITPDADADFTFCGELDGVATTCDIGCNPSTDYSEATHISANTTFELCVGASSSSVCIQNAAAAPSIGISVQFGSSTPINTTIPGGGKLCFHTNSNCSATLDDCF